MGRRLEEQQLSRRHVLQEETNNSNCHFKIVGTLNLPPNDEIACHSNYLLWIMPRMPAVHAEMHQSLMSTLQQVMGRNQQCALPPWV
jgi:hypothetical protein